MWIKICGLRTRDAVDAAVAAGADAIGFVFAPSKRQVTARLALELTNGVPKTIARFAVMQHPSQMLIDEVCSVFKPNVLQTDHADLKSLQLPTELLTLPVFRASQPLPASLPLRLLFEGAISGAGEVGDWSFAATVALRTQLILAGGLSPDNVADAIAKVKPFGVDVSSGVESEPGEKDLAKIALFIKRAKAARAG
jgi:phosphoribosylanthranilate isomerase